MHSSSKRHESFQVPLAMDTPPGAPPSGQRVDEENTTTTNRGLTSPDHTQQGSGGGTPNGGEPPLRCAYILQQVESTWAEFAGLQQQTSVGRC